MIKILLLSDTHGNDDVLQNVLEQETDPDYIFHLGDYYEDLDKYKQIIRDIQIVKVPGIFHKGYKNRTIDAIQQVIIEGWKFLLVHDLNDAVDKARDTDCYLFGHTHYPEFYKNYSKIFINPGHLKSYKDRGSQASYNILEVSKNKLKIIVKDHTGCVITSKFFEK